MSRTLGVQSEKLKELILYICEKSEDDPRFGAIKLAKLLFFIDMEYFFLTGNTLTGKSYQKLNNGPAMRCFVPVRTEMEVGGLIERKTDPGISLNRTTAKRCAKLSLFSDRELCLIDSVIDSLWNENASSLSRKSHDFIPTWEDLPNKAIVKPSMCIFERRQPTAQETDWGKALEERARQLQRTA